MSERERLFLFLAPLNHPDLCYALPVAAWAAEQLGAKLECYLECERQGNLFARTGSTVLGGHHHQQLNYLHARFAVSVLKLGESAVFESSLRAFDDPVLVEAEGLDAFYEGLLALGAQPEGLLYAARMLPAAAQAEDGDFGAFLHNAPEPEAAQLDVGPYLHSEIFFSRSLAYPPERAEGAGRPGLPARTLWMPPVAGMEAVDTAGAGDTFGTLTLRLARRWQHRVQGVAFGDPDVIRACIPTLCRERRVSVYAPRGHKPIAQIGLAAYTENASLIAEEAASLALEINNPVLLGRQTGDADLFRWGDRGVAIQIIDPNRPAFPVVATCRQPWTGGGSVWDDEPDDATLERWAREGRVLSALVFHSGETAHNEAMLQLMDLCAFTGLKLGLAAHLARYETCPQLWELLSVPRCRGGVKGLVEPVLHSGGLGVMAEYNCPPEALAAHCRRALAGIEAIAGAGYTPRGYYFFCDTDLDTLTQCRPALYAALADEGLRYAISSARPGRNRLLPGPIPVLTQTSRTQCQGSPFVRVTTAEDVYESGYACAPGWFIGVLDAPVIAFAPYIWREGSRFMRLCKAVRGDRMTNVLPDTIARYAAILERKGYLQREGGGV